MKYKQLPTGNPELIAGITMPNRQDIFSYLRKTSTALTLTFTALIAHAQNVIEAVTTSTQAGVEVIKIDLTQALPVLPNGFSIQTPARVVLDLPNVGLKFKTISDL
jgi:type IV pilus assembly protein PilQ